MYTTIIAHYGKIGKEENDSPGLCVYGHSGIY